MKTLFLEKDQAMWDSKNLITLLIVLVVNIKLDRVLVINEDTVLVNDFSAFFLNECASYISRAYTYSLKTVICTFSSKNVHINPSHPSHLRSFSLNLDSLSHFGT